MCKQQFGLHCREKRLNHLDLANDLTLFADKCREV